ncbi:hypothetical protein VHEMI03378 [[Torrubiella] hemipterigena]|uniref:Uncharacterized protein n=1 Tax=[Torrubiella] hemipterigena TaxID=1531966 RepID=A0A0A1TAZ9_9HYPO|nr:hypothetical protein VHEMI03378 [[Torrubiella] hemipterigena]
MSPSLSSKSESSSEKQSALHSRTLRHRSNTSQRGAIAKLAKVLPSRRSEKGGTIRSHGYWEEIDAHQTSTFPQQSVEDEQARRLSGPDDLIRWNTAKRIPRPQPPRPLSIQIPNQRLEQDLVSHNQQRKESASVSASQMDRRLSFARRAIEAKREARRQRQSLKESGDYLGVQGINPDTGKLDASTPTESGQSSGGERALERIHAIRKVLSDAKDSYKDVTAWTDREMRSILLDKEGKSYRNSQKQVQKSDMAAGVQWRRQTKQWASVEPISPKSRENDTNLVTPKVSKISHDQEQTNITGDKSFLGHWGQQTINDIAKIAESACTPTTITTGFGQPKSTWNSSASPPRAKTVASGQPKPSVLEICSRRNTTTYQIKPLSNVLERQQCQIREATTATTSNRHGRQAPESVHFVSPVRNESKTDHTQTKTSNPSPAATEVEEKEEILIVRLEHLPMPTLPGTFPNESEGTESPLEIDLKAFCRRLPSFAIGLCLRCTLFGLGFMFAYWRIVQPVFVPNSSLWARQSKGLATGLDSVAMAMALPLVVGGISLLF